MATRRPSDVLAHFATRIGAITTETPDSGFQVSAYRFSPSEEPDSAIDGLFFVDMPEIEKQAPTYGNAETIWNATVTVDVGYFRGGGDLDGGDRQSTLRNAADDMCRIGDVVADPSNYSGSTTGIRQIMFQSARRVVDAKAKEIWRATFFVQWQSDLITA